MPEDDEPTEEPTAQERARRRDRPLVQRAIVSDALMDPEERERIGFDPDPEAPMPVVIELNLRHRDGLEGAAAQFLAHFEARMGDRPPPERVADTYFRTELTQAEILRLVDADQREPDAASRAIYRVWPDFPVHPLIDTSCATVKADAARRSFDATGRGITWAVLDSGIDAHHHHFHRYETLKGDVAGLHRDFTKPGEATLGDALVDNFGHGTHVAGIIAGGLPARMPRGSSLRVVERVFDPARPDTPRVQDRTVSRPEVLAGMARETKLVSLKVLDDRGNGQSMNVLRALEYVRKDVNGYGKLLRIHGVNLSLGYEFDPKWFACGQSPICAEVDRLVRSGVVVVVAAGNTGYGSLTSLARQTNVGLTMTINDPGNAALAITVGATHRDMPHTYGVSYFSSKGPTGDGRLKPDLVAPGERITSCAAGKALASAYPDGKAPTPAKVAAYVEDSGTSMAAPHVSGAVANLLSIRREFIGRPEEVKRVFCESATSLGRERYFQGHGLVDLMRAIQAI
ncbi:MAG TPA: S8 family peptidase [Actinomycetota bacterium]|jgi:subtilisin family serine protease|nr:S8 family peptidase [Actinomycetota bacterium]